MIHSQCIQPPDWRPYRAALPGACLWFFTLCCGITASSDLAERGAAALKKHTKHQKGAVILRTVYTNPGAEDRRKRGSAGRDRAFPFRGRWINAVRH